MSVLGRHRRGAPCKYALTRPRGNLIISQRLPGVDGGLALVGIGFAYVELNL